MDGDTSELSRDEKYQYMRTRLSHPDNPGLATIAQELGITLSSLYVMRSDMARLKKLQDSTTAQQIIEFISFENFKDYLRNYPKYEYSEYLLELITGDRKPLRSNLLKVIETIRDMIKTEFQ